MTEIVINGVPLHRVQMLLEPQVQGPVSRLSYPSDRFSAIQNGDELELMIPAFLTLELYRVGLVSEDESAVHEVVIEGKQLGAFYFGELEYPSRPGEELIRIKMYKGGP